MFKSIARESINIILSITANSANADFYDLYLLVSIYNFAKRGAL